ncbi:hypothetical protein CPC08DRAFT_719528 [Agrocybe pediades]|nr:hypothetical protein CPC08DRAFT_719528 [Agrocybe pediades]
MYCIHLCKPPNAGLKKKAPSDGTATPRTRSQSNPHHSPSRPFKSPNYTKNVNSRAKNLKNQEEPDRANSNAVVAPGGIPEEAPTYTTIEARPSLIPHKHLCDITSLEAPYIDPTTGLCFHDKSIYDIVRGLNQLSIAKDYLSSRGVNPIVKQLLNKVVLAIKTSCCQSQYQLQKLQHYFMFFSDFIRGNVKGFPLILTVVLKLVLPRTYGVFSSKVNDSLLGE